MNGAFDEFVSEVRTGGRVCTFAAGDDFPLYPVPGGRAVPFWSSRARIELVHASDAQYSRYCIFEMSAADFLDWLAQLGEEGFRVGLNWNENGLTGEDVAAKDLRAALEAPPASAGAASASGRPAAGATGPARGRATPRSDSPARDSGGRRTPRGARSSDGPRKSGAIRKPARGRPNRRGGRKPRGRA